MDLINDIPECQILSKRIVDVPREMVFKAYSDPAHLVNWWGPRDFTNTFQEFSFVPGGHWRFIMHGPDGRDYENECVFVKIAVPELIIMNHVSAPVFQVAISFEEIETIKTRIIFRMIFNTVAECNKLKSLVFTANEENFDRLEEELEKIKHSASKLS